MALIERIDLARARVTDLARSTLLESPARLRRRWPHLPPTERRRVMGLVLDAVLIRPGAGDALTDQLLFVPFGMSGEGLPQPMRPATRVPYEWPRRSARTGFAVLAAEDPPLSFC